MTEPIRHARMTGYPDQALCGLHSMREKFVFARKGRKVTCKKCLAAAERQNDRHQRNKHKIRRNRRAHWDSKNIWRPNRKTDE